MKNKIMLYGSAQCEGCMMIKEKLDDAGIRYGYVDVLASLAHLKKFLGVRDNNPEVYTEMVKEGKVGIPTLVINDEQVILGREDLDVLALAGDK